MNAQIQHFDFPFENEQAKVSKNGFGFRINSYGFKEDEFYVQYVPSLGLSAYGDSPEEALNGIKGALEIFIENYSELSLSAQVKWLYENNWIKSKYLFTDVYTIEREQLSKMTVNEFGDLVDPSKVETTALQVA